LIADARNQHLADGELPFRPADVMPYFDPFGEDITLEELAARIGFGTHGTVTEEPPAETPPPAEK
jgi:hypothetical protein